MKYIEYLNNNFVFSALIGLIAVIVTYCYTKNDKENRPNLKTHMKIFVLVTVSVVAALYLKSMNLFGGNKSQSGGAPNMNQAPRIDNQINTDYFQKVDLDNPQF